MQRTGAQIVWECLVKEGVEVVFGYPGGAILPTYDPLMDSAKVRHILVRHEQGGGHAASGYAHATGKVGVTMATSGPGATNLVTAIADAYMDSIPLVAITGQVYSKYIGKMAFQETDIFGLTLPVVKHSYLVLDVHELAVQEVQKKAQRMGLHNVTAVLARGYDCTLPAGTAHVVCCLDMFFGVREPTTLLSELKRVTKPDGVLIIDDGHQPRAATLAKIRASGQWTIAAETRDHLICRPIA